MKRLLPIFFCIIFFSCGKDHNKSTTDDSSFPTLQYKVDGVLQQYSGQSNSTDPQSIIAVKHLNGTIFGDTYYQVTAQKGVNNLLSFSIGTDSLRTGTYKGKPLLTFILVGGNEYTILDSTQIFDIVITKNRTGIIDGNFSGRLYWYTDPNIPNSVSVTEGEFKNVKITY